MNREAKKARVRVLQAEIEELEVEINQLQPGDKITAYGSPYLIGHEGVFSLETFRFYEEYPFDKAQGLVTRGTWKIVD